MIGIRAVTCVALTTFLCAASSLAGANSERSSARGSEIVVEVAKRLDGPYKDFVSGKLKKGESIVLYFRTRSNVGEQEVRLFDRSSSNDAYRVRWYRGKKVRPEAEITEQVQGEGYPFTASRSSKWQAQNLKYTGGGGRAGFCAVGQVGSPTVLDSAFAGLNGNRCVE